MQLGEITEQHLNSGKRDSKGRFIGYTVGFRDNGTEFYAWVQAARCTNGTWADFGVHQRSKCFASQEAATLWAFDTAHTRITNLK
jgi:hypothetical protein